MIKWGYKVDKAIYLDTCDRTRIKEYINLLDIEEDEVIVLCRDTDLDKIKGKGLITNLLLITDGDSIFQVKNNPSKNKTVILQEKFPNLDMEEKGITVVVHYEDKLIETLVSIEEFLK